MNCIIARLDLVPFKETFASKCWLCGAASLADEDLDDGDVDEVTWWEISKVSPRNWLTIRNSRTVSFIITLEVIMTMLNHIGLAPAEAAVGVRRATLRTVSPISGAEGFCGTGDRKSNG
ncbi:hypothetical protein B0A48_11574 [Cryoendolithus antarcticus]|uniref:Uncharacterized protein n=1 Tax=Cryoendolithus antarcticus TaxID=1507870 RepID=A0A1V8SWE9_9PEZI|nr:hypothetical protein B0A48_11574 [Cryoendolithus antarcticus]